MPSNWLAMDDNFPTFTGEESPKEQIRALHNYLYQMREGLQYSMRNLTADNFNEAALSQMTDAQKEAVTEELKKLQSMIAGFDNELATLRARVAGVENLEGRVNTLETEIDLLWESSKETDQRMQDAETAIAGLEQELEQAQAELDAQSEQIGQAQADIDELDIEQGKMKATVDALSKVIRIQEDGSVTIGEEGTTLSIVGTVYINGTLYGQGGNADAT